MKLFSKFAAIVLAIVLAASLCACSTEVAPNSVFSVEDLPGKTIGVQLGTTGDIYASDYEAEGSTIERYNKGSEAVLALKQGKIDCVIIDEEPAKVFVEENEDLMILDEPFEKEEYAICVAKENSELKDDINDALAQLKKDGTIDQIIANYIGDETKGTCPYVSPEDVDRSNGKLVMATNAEFKPYEYYDNNEIVGIDVELAQAIADILGKELVIDDMQFNAIVSAVASGKADVGIAGLSITEDRLKNVDFTEPYTTATQVIIVRKK